MRIVTRRGLAPLSRRAFVRGLGAAGLMPLVPRLSARADDRRRPLNLVLVYHPNGLEPGWAPRVAADGGLLLGGTTLAALAPWRGVLRVVDGLRGGIRNEIMAHPQGMTSLWTGARIGDDDAFAGHPSVDRLVAARIGSGTPLRTLDLGVQTNASGRLTNTTAMLYDGPGRAVEPENDPNAVFERLFGGVGADPEQLAAIRRARGSVFDLVRDQLRGMRADYGAEDRARIERHHEHVSGLEARLRALEDRTCSADYSPHAHPSRAVAGDDRLFPELTGLQIDLLVSALTCGLTRVASLQLSDSVSGTRIAGVNDGVGLHGVMHTGTREEKVRINRWFVAQLATLLSRLSEVSFEDGRTLLDDTLVVWGTEMAVGNHLNDPVPFVLAGAGADGVLGPGRRVTVDDGSRHTRLLVSILHAFGANDVSRVGDFVDSDSVGPLTRLVEDA